MRFPVEESGGARSMSRSEYHFDFPSAEVNLLSVREILYLPFVVFHHRRHIYHVRGIDPNLVKKIHGRPRMVRMHMSGCKHDRLGGDTGHNFVQIRNIGTGIYQKSFLVTLYKIDGFIVAQMSVALPGMLVNLSEHDIAVTIHLFLDVSTVRPGR